MTKVICQVCLKAVVVIPVAGHPDGKFVGQCPNPACKAIAYFEDRSDFSTSSIAEVLGLSDELDIFKHGELKDKEQLFEYKTVFGVELSSLLKREHDEQEYYWEILVFARKLPEAEKKKK